MSQNRFITRLLNHRSCSCRKSIIAPSMGTSGSFGFTYKGKKHLSYNHCDSYPEGLGKNIVDELKYAIDNNLLDEWTDKLDRLKEVSDEIPPTDNDVKALEKYTDLNVSDGSTDDWYCLLRKTQGSLRSILECGYILSFDEVGEYTYVVNMDRNILMFESLYDAETFPFDGLPDW